MAEHPDLLDFLRDLPDAELVWSWHCAEKELADILFTRDAHRGELLRRIADAQTTGLETERGNVTKEPSFGEYQWDIQKLTELVLCRLLSSQVTECVEEIPASLKVKTVAVKKYAKLLGISEDELSSCYIRPEQTPKLKFSEAPRPLLSALRDSVVAAGGVAS